jgi:hypothetical protein
LRLSSWNAQHVDCGALSTAITRLLFTHLQLGQHWQRERVAAATAPQAATKEAVAMHAHKSWLLVGRVRPVGFLVLGEVFLPLAWSSSYISRACRQC